MHCIQHSSYDASSPTYAAVVALAARPQHADVLHIPATVEQPRWILCIFHNSCRLSNLLLTVRFFQRTIRLWLTKAKGCATMHDSACALYTQLCSQGTLHKQHVRYAGHTSETAVRQGLCAYWTAANSIFFYTAMVGSLREPWVAHAGRTSSRETSGRQAARATPSRAALALTTSPAPTTPLRSTAGSCLRRPPGRSLRSCSSPRALPRWPSGPRPSMPGCGRWRPLSPVHPACSTSSTFPLSDV